MPGVGGGYRVMEGSPGCERTAIPGWPYRLGEELTSRMQGNHILSVDWQRLREGSSLSAGVTTVDHGELGC